MRTTFEASAWWHVPLATTGIVLLFLIVLVLMGWAIEDTRQRREAENNYMRTCIVVEREDRCKELWRWRMPEK